MRERIFGALTAAMLTVNACSGSNPVVGGGTDVMVPSDKPGDVASGDGGVMDAPVMDVTADTFVPPDLVDASTPPDVSDASAPTDTADVSTPTDAGLMCPSGRVVCDDRCVDTSSDVAHCGMCGNTCAAGNACRDGRCVVVCPGTQTVCGGACVTTANDPAHCGMCDNACPAGQLCNAGTCACPTGTTRCGDRCVDTNTDAAHCGMCSNACARGEVCATGRCQLQCPASQTACSGACVTTATDALHCGACDMRCATGARCEAGMCRCPEGQTDCGGRCVDTSTSTTHCGMCDRACTLDSATAACVTGVCRVAGCATGRGDCDTMAANGCETDVTGSVAHCGACGRACTLAHATPACRMGACAVATCDTGFADCDMNPTNGCETDTRSDTNNCGACGMTCATGACVNGSCAAPRSCQEVRTLQPTAASGRFMIDPDGAAGAGAPFEVYCDMTTAGGGWTYLATVTNSGDAANMGRWLVTSPTPNAWESTSLTFGTLDPTRNEDYRSAAFHSVEGRAVMITHRNQFLLATDDGCLQGRTLQASLTRLGWTCGGSEDFTRHPDCTHSCVIASSTPRTGDTALLAGATRARLYLKAGEADGAQDANRDRAYLSTSYRDNVDYPTGLGAFCSGTNCSPRTGEADVNDRSDAITPTVGTEFYGIWIR